MLLIWFSLEQSASAIIPEIKSFYGEIGESFYGEKFGESFYGGIF